MRNDSESTSYLFLSRPALLPRAVQAAYPAATFIARAHQGDTWGILLAVAPADLPPSPAEDILTDDGQTLAAVIVPADPAADPAAVLAAAKYWELPPAYVATLPR